VGVGRTNDGTGEGPLGMAALEADGPASGDDDTEPGVRPAGGGTQAAMRPSSVSSRRRMRERVAISVIVTHAARMG
jgi:hypothetical protein